MLRHFAIIMSCLVLFTQQHVQAEDVELNGISLHYKVHGSGPPLLLLHGYTTSGDDTWKAIIPKLREDFKLYVMDLRGHGSSTFSEEPYSHRLVAKDIVALLDHLELESVAAIGASSGANALLHVATKEPSRLHSMILIGCGQYLPANAREALGSKEVAEMYLSDSRLSTIHSGGREQWDYIRRGVRALCDTYTDMNFTPPLLSTIQTRTLIMHGDRDEFFPLHMPVELYQSLPNAELWIVPGTGHNLFYPPGADPDLEQRFVTRVAKFLKATEPSDPPHSR